MHLATYKASAAGALLAHYERSIGDREHIDRDGVVVNIAPEYEGGARQRYKEITKGLEFNSKTRPLADMLVTKPKGYDGDTMEFFRAVYNALTEKVGRDNVVCAYVHMDEPGAQPHMHFCFVPVVETTVMTNDKSQPLRWTKRDEQKNPEHKAGEIKTDSKGTKRYRRVPKRDEQGNVIKHKTAKCSAVFTREDMNKLHPWMERELCRRLGVEHVGIELDESDDAKVLSKLGHEEYVRTTAEIERAKEEKDALGAEVESIKRRLESLQRSESELADEVEELQSSTRTFSESREIIAEGAGVDERVERLEQEVESTRTRLSGLESERDRLVSDCERYAREIASDERETRRVERSINGIGNRIRSLTAVWKERGSKLISDISERAARVLNSFGVNAMHGHYASQQELESLFGTRSRSPQVRSR